MASDSPTVLLDLAQSITNAALLITKSQLQENVALSSHDDNALPNGINGAVKKKAPSAPAQSTKDVLDAKANLVQAASDLSTLVLGPSTYLKSLSYGVSHHLSAMTNLSNVH